MKWLRKIKSIRAYDRLYGRIPTAAVEKEYARIIFKPDRLGDLVLSSGSIRAAAAGLPPERCLLIVSEVAAPLADMLFPEFPQLTIPFDCRPRKEHEKTARVRDLLSAVACDELVCLRHQRSDFFSLCLSWIRASHTYALALAPSPDEDWLRRREDERLSPLTFTAPEPPTQPVEIHRHFAVLSQLSPCPASADALLPQLPTPSETDDTLIVSPLGSQPIRDIPPELLLKLLAPFEKKRIGRALLCGGPPQEAKLTELAARLRRERPDLLFEVSSSAPLKTFVQQVAQANAVISTDTVTAHLATAMDKRAFIVLAGGQYGQWGPWKRSERQVWLTHPLPCFHCDWNCPFPVPRCIHEIDVGAFAEPMRRSLEA